MRAFKTLFFLGIFFFCLISWFGYQYFQKPLSMSAYTIVHVQHGDSLRAISENLRLKGVISNQDEFLLWGKIFRHGSKIRTGEYGIPTGTTMDGLFSILRSGKSLGYRVSIPEGSNMLEIAQRLEELKLCSAEAFMKVVRDPQFIRSVLGRSVFSLEGYLFPDTYFFTKIDGAKIIARKLVQRFKDKTSHLTIPNGWSLDQVVTLASIIEKETGAEEERPLISSVFHNRLRKKMRLQTDPTVIYAKYLVSGHYELKISREDLGLEHSYNTYRKHGLPPGPISNPGLEALEAALNPAPSEYLFFVSRNDGTHVFTTEYKDHLRAVGDFQLNKKAREGRSWRDLKKNRETLKR